jgi:hypothetical protein
MFQKIVVAAGTFLPNHCLATTGYTDRPWAVLSHDADSIENDEYNSSIFACVFVEAVMFLPSPYLAMRKGYTYRQTDERLIKYVDNMR